MNLDQANQALSPKGNHYVKAVVLLTISFFMISAPAPEANDLADITSNLIISGAPHAAELQYPLI